MAKTENKAVQINEQVKVIASFEDNNNSFFCNPIKMEFRGKEVTFGKFRINYSDTEVGDERVFDLFDQERSYRLIFNMENLSWFLASIGLRA